MALEEAGLQLIAQGVAAYISDINKADKETTGFYSTLGDSGKSAGSFQQVITGALREVGASLIQFGIQGAKAIGGFVKDSIGLAGDFESGMLNFQAVAGKDVDAKGLEEFRDLFIDIGKRLPVSTMEVQQAAAEMVKGGIDPATIAAGGLEQGIQFAAAAMEGDLVKAAEISSKILGGWSDVNATAADKAAFLTHSTDMLTKAANASATDVEGLSRGIFNAQGIARTAGVSFDDLTTTLAELAPRFASSSEAGNSLKNMIARLQPTTKPAAAMMEDLGLFTEEAGSAFYDAQGNFVGFQQASQLLQDSLQGLTKEQKAQALQTIFGNDAMGSAAALAELGGQGYQNMADALAKANGVADAAALKQQGFNTSLDNAKGSVEALQITIGSFLLPILGDLLDNYIAPAVNTLTDFASALFGDEEAFAKLSPTMQGVATTIGMLFDDVSNIVGAFSDAGAMSSEFGEAIGLLASDLGLPGELIQDIVFAVQDVVSWFDQGGASAESLGGAVDDLTGVWQLAQKVVEDVADGYLAIISAILPQVQEFINEHGTEISAFFQTTWDTIIDIITLALELYDAIVPPILQAIAGFIEAHGSEIQKIFSGVWNAVSAIISGALETIKTVLKLALDLIHGDWDAAWKDIQHIAEVQWTAIKEGVEGILNAIAGIFDTSVADIITLWENNWKQLVDIATQTDWAQVGQDVVDGIIAGLAAAWSSLVGWIVEKMGGLVGSAIDAIDGGSPAMKFAPVGVSAVQGIMLGFQEQWPALTDQLGELMDGLLDKMKDIGAQVQGVIADAFGATASIDRQLAANLDKLKDVLPIYRQYTEGALKAAAVEAQQFADPAQGAKYYQLKSKQILEYAKLQKDLADQEQATRDAESQRIEDQKREADLKKQLAQDLTDEQRDALEKQLDVTTDINAAKAIQAKLDADLTDSQRESLQNDIKAAQQAQINDDAARQESIDSVERLKNQMALINAAQTAELAQFNANQAGQTSPAMQLVGQINEIVKSLSDPKLKLTDAQIAMVDQLSGLVAMLSTPQANPWANPTTTMPNVSTSNVTNLNMPIYSNQSPTVMRDSMAIARAAML